MPDNDNTQTTFRGGQFYRDFTSFARTPKQSVLDSVGVPDIDKTELRMEGDRTRKYFAHVWKPYVCIVCQAVCGAYHCLAYIPIAFREQWAYDRRK